METQGGWRTGPLATEVFSDRRPVGVKLRTEWSIIPRMLSTKTNVPEKRAAPAGRPRGFLPEQALQSALEVFWEKGYEATSLDDLTRAMRLSRSSFYACFGSKPALLMAAVESYANSFYDEIRAIAAGEPDPIRALRQIVARVVDVDGGARGCFFLNSVVELAPHNDSLAAYSRVHLARLTTLVANLLVRTGLHPSLCDDRATAVLALAMGAIMLRKAGVPSSRLRALLEQANLMLTAR